MKQAMGRGLIVVLVAGITFFYPLLAPTPHRLNYIHFGRIKPGMTAAEVEAIFGVPAGVYDGVTSKYVEKLTTQARDLRGYRLPLPEPSTLEIWISRNGSFTVLYDSHGHVVGSIHCQDRFMPWWEEWWHAIKTKF